MFDQWHIQYCLILRMTLMLQRQHHLPERILFIECNLVHRAMDHYHSIVWPLVYCNSIREALNRRDRLLNAEINLFQNITISNFLSFKKESWIHKTLKRSFLLLAAFYAFRLKEVCKQIWDKTNTLFCENIESKFLISETLNSDTLIKFMWNMKKESWYFKKIQTLTLYVKT